MATRSTIEGYKINQLAIRSADFAAKNLKQADNAAAARPGSRGRLANVVNFIAQSNNIKVPLSLPYKSQHPRDQAGPNYKNRSGLITKSRRFSLLFRLE